MRDEIDRVTRSGTVLVLFLVAVGYLASYAYHFGYLSYLKIPNTFVSLTIPSLVVSIAATIFAVFVIFFCVAKYIGYEKEHKSEKRLIFFRTIGICVALSVVYLCTFWLLGSGAALTMLVYVLLLIFGPLAGRMIKQKSFAKGWNEYRDVRYRSSRSDAAVLDLLPVSIGLYMAIALSITLISFFIGGMASHMRNEYPEIVRQGNNKTLVITKNDSELITKEYNVSTKSFEDGYSVRSIADTLKMTTFKFNEAKDPVSQFFSK